jgi:two-component system LytT family response regulator
MNTKNTDDSKHNRLSVLIVDDEELARRLTKEYLKSHSDCHIIGECEHGLEAVDAIAELNPDIIFLDIQMPQLNGLEVLEATGRRTGVIFTTAYDQYALKAFDQHAVDYLLKPFSQARFDEALEKARFMLGQTSTAINQLISDSQIQLERIVVRDRGHTHIVLVNTIEYIEAQDDYIQIHYDGKKLMKTQSLTDLESQLNTDDFIRIHRSYLLYMPALKCLEKSSKDSHMAILHNGVQLPISRSGYERLKAVL